METRVKTTRTWQQALDAIIETKSGSTQDRWRQAAKQAALDLIRNRVILGTQAEHLLACLKAGTVSTNVHLRKLHNFCLSMNWLPWPIIPKRLWPEGQPVILEIVVTEAESVKNEKS